MSRQDRGRSYFIFLLAITIFTIFIVAVFIPFCKDSCSLNESIAAKKKMLAHYRQLLEERELIRKTYLEHFSLRERKEQADPSVVILQELEEIAESSAVKIVDIRQNKQNSGAFLEFVIDIKLEGKESSFLTFINNLKNSSFLFRIKKLNLKSQRTSPLLSAQFLISCLHSR